MIKSLLILAAMSFLLLAGIYFWPSSVETSRPETLESRMTQRNEPHIKRKTDDVVIIVRTDAGRHYAKTLQSYLKKYANTSILDEDAWLSADMAAPSHVIHMQPQTCTSRSLPAEAFQIILADRDEIWLCGAPEAHRRAKGNIGLGFGAFELLQVLGVQFLHPLSPRLPPKLMWERVSNVTEKPMWPMRGIHLHTMHPIEMTEMLQGYGAYHEDETNAFESGLPEWSTYVDWLLAHKQNRVQWVLLRGEDDFDKSRRRQERLTKIVDIAHQHGLQVGIGAPIRQHQQRAWRLIDKADDYDAQIQELKESVDYLMAMGFDYISTANGTSEFTSPPAETMLAWADALVAYMDEAYSAEVNMSLHISTGQKAELEHVKQGGSDNINLLPTQNDKRMVLWAHTVQPFALDDYAPTYGNTDFHYIRQAMRDHSAVRKMVWFPESAYWLSTDIDVPLFMPVYAERRIHDLQLIRADETSGMMGADASGHQHRISGQMIFSSGWEWGYWLNDLIAAEAAWQLPDKENRYKMMLRDVFKYTFEGQRLADLIGEVSETQYDLWMTPTIAPTAPDADKSLLWAYLQGWETWDDLTLLLQELFPSHHVNLTQPAKLSWKALREETVIAQNIRTALKKNTRQMKVFATEAKVLKESCTASLGKGPCEIHREIYSGIRLAERRSELLQALLTYQDGDSIAVAHIDDIMKTASMIASENAEAYRVSSARIARWGPNSTAYRFGYLWTAHRLFYWQRDVDQVVHGLESPCHKNIINPFDIAIGHQKWTRFGDRLRTIFSSMWLAPIGDCMGVRQPAEE